MRIIELKAENFKRLVAVHVKPTAAVTSVTGKNGAGKTSVLDALALALGGTGNAPALPIRKGQERAKVIVVTDEYVITRKWTKSGSSLEITNAEGAVYKAPQRLLDKVVGDLSFDPLKFARLKATEQAAVLAKIANIDIDFHHRTRATLLADRTIANKSAKDIRVQIAGMPPIADDVPDAEVPVAEIMEELTAAEEARRVRVRAEIRAGKAATRVDQAEKRIEKLRAELLAAEREYIAATEDRATAAQVVAELPPLPDIEAINLRGRGLEGVNRQVRAKQLKATREKDAAGLEAVAKGITTKIEILDAGLAERLAAATMPVPGLSIGEHGVTFNGIPFEQCSGAEKLRVSVAIGLAPNPELKLMLIPDGSLLDADGMRLLEELAEAAGAQILIERVGTSREAGGVLIIDGSTEEVAPVA